MAAGLQVYDSSGVLVWDSATVVGCIFADVREYGDSDTDTLTYPDFAGATPVIVNCNGSEKEGSSSGNGVVADTSLGYPRVTVSSGGGSGARRFAVMLF